MEYQPTHLPKECQNMNDIRAEIDKIDQLVIRLLSTRLGYVKAAAKFKTNTTDV